MSSATLLRFLPKTSVEGIRSNYTFGDTENEASLSCSRFFATLRIRKHNAASKTWSPLGELDMCSEVISRMMHEFNSVKFIPLVFFALCCRQVPAGLIKMIFGTRFGSFQMGAYFYSMFAPSFFERIQNYRIYYIPRNFKPKKNRDAFYSLREFVNNLFLL